MGKVEVTVKIKVMAFGQECPLVKVKVMVMIKVMVRVRVVVVVVMASFMDMAIVKVINIPQSRSWSVPFLVLSVKVGHDHMAKLPWRMA